MIEITFENIESAIIESNNFTYEADGNGNIKSIKFNQSSIVYDSWVEIEGDRILEYNDITDIVINGSRFDIPWEYGKNDSNLLQSGELKDGIITIKWKGME